MAVATALSVAMLRFEPQSHQTSELMQALGKAARESGFSGETHGHAEWLMLWGPGAPDRFPVMQRQIARGGHVIAWDAPYWQRGTKYRVTIDAAHPQAWVMRRELPSSRLERDIATSGLRIADAWKADGPVIVAGIGRKATVQYGADVVQRWELNMIGQARARGYRVLYRPKRKHEGRVPGGVEISNPAIPIDTALAGSAGVVTWHSNVAVDAIRMGVPVICKDGAAAAVCPSSFPETWAPLDPAITHQFLSNLAWFQWAPSEAKTCLSFLRELLA